MNKVIAKPRKKTISAIRQRDSLIVVDPEILGGVPVFKGTRVPLKNLMDYLEAGDSLDVFLDEFPTVSREQVVAVLEQAKEMMIASASTDRRVPAANRQKASLKH